MSYKVKSRADAINRYGAIDFSSLHWPRQDEWLKKIDIPVGWFPNWKVLNSSHIVTGFYVNKDMHEPLSDALIAIHNKGLGALLHTFDGCFNIRMVRGTTGSVSAHSYGLALDINADENPLGSTHGGFYNQPELVKCFTDQGFDAGINFSGRKDPMHYSWCWEHPASR